MTCHGRIVLYVVGTRLPRAACISEQRVHARDGHIIGLFNHGACTHLQNSGNACVRIIGTTEEAQCVEQLMIIDMRTAGSTIKWFTPV